MTNPVEWNTTPEKAPIVPVPQPNREALRGIPLGVPLMLINMHGTSVEFSAANWDEQTRDSWIEQLDDEEETFGSSSLFYVNPRILRDPPVEVPPLEVKREAVLSDRDLVDKHVQEWDLTDPDMDTFLMRLVRAAREGMVENPF